MRSVSIFDLNTKLTMCGSSNLAGNRLRNSSFEDENQRRGDAVTALIHLLLLFQGCIHLIAGIGYSLHVLVPMYKHELESESYLCS